MNPIGRAIDVGLGNTKRHTASANGKVDSAHFASLAFIRAGQVNRPLPSSVFIRLDAAYQEVVQRTTGCVLLSLNVSSPPSRSDSRQLATDPNR